MRRAKTTIAGASSFTTRIESLSEYVVISHREPRIDHYQRLESGQWLTSMYRGPGEQVLLPALGGSFDIADVYAGVDLQEGRTST